MTDVAATMVVADDDRISREWLVATCAEARVKAVPCEDAESAVSAIREAVRSGGPVGVVTDLKMRGLKSGEIWGGWQVLQRAAEVSRNIPLAAWSGYPNDNIVKLFASGAAVPAFTMFFKPEDREKLRAWIGERAQAWGRRASHVLMDPSTQEIYDELAPVYARSTLPVLIVGPSGTGKEGLARLIHDLSGRQDGPFVAFNCGALEEGTAATELFGHQAGSFSDATVNELGLVLKASGYRAPDDDKRDERFITWLARGTKDLVGPGGRNAGGFYDSDSARREAGTLFLDEVTALPPRAMAGLLRVLSSRDVVPHGHRGIGIRSYCRIIAATNEEDVLHASATRSEAVSPGREMFRHDLFYRLSGVVLRLRALRDRDASVITEFVLRSQTWRELELPMMDVSDTAVQRLVSLYHGSDPIGEQYQHGNFRSLRNLVHRAALIARADDCDEVSDDHVDLAIRHGVISAVGRGNVNRAASNAEEIRGVFARTLSEHGVALPKGFGSKEIRTTAKSDATLVARGFLRCALMSVDRSDGKKGMLDLGDIEDAITGGRSPNTILNKVVKASHFWSVAEREFGLGGQVAPKDIIAVVKRVRESETRREETPNRIG